ncbi:hypothetical protein ILUMI_18174 [Ignelater luminosus]|uniref:Uncharacterized protein n=1 Tax=Ignelater luminosus TaxID=2038154 RepID=A0A8K0G6M9_IGNLU|nr:hypothetical protein ILUMI_18174 [Ignelater luminosus]
MKLSKRGQGPPGREPVMTEEERKQLMLHAYRKQEELKKLEADDDDNYLNSEWADVMQEQLSPLIDYLSSGLDSKRKTR